MTFQFLRVGGEVAEVFKFLVQDRIQQQRTWSRTLKFQLAEVPKVFAQARVPQLPHRVGRLLDVVDEGIQGVFRTFPRPKKSAEVTCQSSLRVLGSVSSFELSSHQMAPAEESDETGEDEAGDALSAAHVALRRLRRRRGGRGRGLRRRCRLCSCAEVRGYSSYGRPCALQRQVPAVQGV